MKVILANPRGFCAGVDMAIESLDRALELFSAPIYVFHEIVHNRTVVNDFEKKGVTFVGSVEEVPRDSTLLFSAHGVSPEIRNAAKERNIKAIDATCPLVTKVHTEALRFAKEDYQIVLIGHAGHDEVIGTMGEVPDRITLVETEKDVASLPFTTQTKLAYLTQTTLSVDDANRIIRVLRERFPQIVGPPREDICYATQNRQEAVRLLSAGADVVLVLGSQNSSNSQRLAEIARQLGKTALLVDKIEEAPKDVLAKAEVVLITAGASAPEHLVESTVRYLQTNYNATVESKVVREEHVLFALPKELRTPRPATV